MELAQWYHELTDAKEANSTFRAGQASAAQIWVVGRIDDLMNG